MKNNTSPRVNYTEGITKNPSLYLSYERTDQPDTWCAGCGNYAIQSALIRALTLKGVTQKECVLCYDVGCSGNESDKIGAFTIHGLHGRVLPLATGVHLANHRLLVIAQAGDGATFSEGINHLIHTIRHDPNIVFIHHNNGIYGLTTGQASSTTQIGQKVHGTLPTSVDPIDPVDFVLSLNPTFVARGFSGNIPELTECIMAAMEHQGFSFVEVIQSCPTYNQTATHEWGLAHTSPVADIPDYDETSLESAKSLQHKNEKYLTGVLYRNPRTDFYASLPQRKKYTTTLIEEVKRYDLESYLDKCI